MTLQNMNLILRDLSIRHYQNQLKRWEKSYDKERRIEEENTNKYNK